MDKIMEKRTDYGKENGLWKSEWQSSVTSSSSHLYFWKKILLPKIVSKKLPLGNGRTIF